jgi:N-acetylneuraminic acid mutarotase
VSDATGPAKRRFAGVAFSIVALALVGCSPGESSGSATQGERTAGTWSEAAALPAPVANNAVAAVSLGGSDLVFSFLGLDSTRLYSGIHDRVFRFDVAAGEWSELAGPGAGRIAGTAQTVRGKIYLFGGYTVAADGSEKSLPDVDILDPATGEWSGGAPIPLPVDDAVSGVWRDSLIYIVSGWHDTDNVRDVQIYDPFTDSWQAATPIPGPPAFGHSGGIAGDAIVYVDGVATFDSDPRFRITDAAYLGMIDPQDPANIEWRELPPHPGPPLYRMAALGVGRRVLFAGGTDNPYNYNGVGYDGNPSQPSNALFAFDVSTGAWEILSDKPLASMDHRGFAAVGSRLFILGGMVDAQQVTARVQVLQLGGSAR